MMKKAALTQGKCARTREGFPSLPFPCLAFPSRERIREASRGAHGGKGRGTGMGEVCAVVIVSLHKTSHPSLEHCPLLDAGVIS